MYICLCHGVTDKQIKKQLEQGSQSLTDVREQLGVASQCGKCAKAAQDVIKQHQVANMPEIKQVA